MRLSDTPGSPRSGSRAAQFHRTSGCHSPRTRALFLAPRGRNAIVAPWSGPGARPEMVRAGRGVTEPCAWHLHRTSPNLSGKKTGVGTLAVLGHPRADAGRAEAAHVRQLLQC